MMLNRFDIDNIDNLLLINTANEFDDVVWDIEPSESFKELCKQRALQIRESYDYVVLHFSGGSDSTTVLNSFIENKIPIDEIVINKFDGVDSACLDGKKAEKDLISKNYSGLVTIVNITNEKIIRLLNNDNLIIDTPNWTGQLHAFARFPIQYLEKYDFVKSKNRTGKICNLNGEQEPFVQRKHNGFYCKLTIKRKFVVCFHSTFTTFFTDTKFPKLHVKQCHILARFMQKYPNIFITNKIKKMLLRDSYSPILSPIKAYDTPEFALKNKNSYSEPSILLKAYTKDNDKFEDLYTNSVLKEMINITSKIKTIASQHERYYKLFDDV